MFSLNTIFLITFLVVYFYFIFSKKSHMLLRVTLLIGAFYMSLFPFLLSKEISSFLGSFYRYYANTLNTVFVATIVLFCLVLFTKITFIYKPSKKFAIALFSISALVATYSLYEGLKVPSIKEVIIADKDIKQNQTIVFLSDIHINKNISTNKIKGLVKKVNAINPDVIILGGDILDDTYKNNTPYLAELKNLKAKKGIYFVAGNHEVYRGIGSTSNQLKNAGFNYLFNSGVDIGGGVYVAGLPDVRAQKKDVNLKQAVANASADSFIILASHTPKSFEENNSLFDLMLSGHTHGGQIFPFHFLVKNQHKYLAGLYDFDKGDSSIYVSRGAGQWGPQLRFLAPAEISVIKLEALK